jgi:hypothetical protein
MYALGVDRKSYPALPTWHRLVARPQSPSKPANWQLAFCSGTSTKLEQNVFRYWKTQRLVFSNLLLYFVLPLDAVVEAAVVGTVALLPHFLQKRVRGGHELPLA